MLLCMTLGSFDLRAIASSHHALRSFLGAWSGVAAAESNSEKAADGAQQYARVQCSAFPGTLEPRYLPEPDETFLGAWSAAAAVVRHSETAADGAQQHARVKDYAFPESPELR
eukprot:CAMPEP_0169261842 /NCGR_PEP_ID=MMETSP1016-20121227/43336_1 /TAXON_ID=342587 /ORGANISM="Karlodinium micrum, Strain CCMP2283" /LENGTH=112 /DNA_ID=CAMNT_0009344221 /DNA_START=253 /DNA_END=592 /DNA_ORIENTATION=+